MLAFFIIVDGFDDMVAAADTLPKARYVAFKSAREAGYSSVTFDRIRGSRAPKLDQWAAKQEKPCLRARSQAEWEAA